MNKRPYTDLEELVEAATDQAVDERVLPAVEELKKATRELRAIAPHLQGLNQRQNGHEVWLIILSALLIVDLALDIISKFS